MQIEGKKKCCTGTEKMCFQAPQCGTRAAPAHVLRHPSDTLQDLHLSHMTTRLKQESHPMTGPTRCLVLFWSSRRPLMSFCEGRGGENEKQKGGKKRKKMKEIIKRSFFRPPVNGRRREEPEGGRVKETDESLHLLLPCRRNLLVRESFGMRTRRRARQRWSARGAKNNRPSL